MAPRKPIEVEIEEARRAVAPETLEDVLETLQKHGSIAYFIVCASRVLVWENPERRLEVALFSSDTIDHINQELKRTRQ